MMNNRPCRRGALSIYTTSTPAKTQTPYWTPMPKWSTKRSLRSLGSREKNTSLCIGHRDAEKRSKPSRGLVRPGHARCGLGGIGKPAIPQSDTPLGGCVLYVDKRVAFVDTDDSGVDVVAVYVFSRALACVLWKALVPVGDQHLGPLTTGRYFRSRRGLKVVMIPASPENFFNLAQVRPWSPGPRPWPVERHSHTEDPHMASASVVLGFECEEGEEWYRWTGCVKQMVKECRR